MAGADAADVPYAFYEVGEDLTTPPDALAAVEAEDMVLVIHYFGFLNPLARDLRQSGQRCFILEDATQALLTSDIGTDGDGVLYSPRKFLGVPDGGVLTVKDGIDISPAELRPPSSSWWHDQYGAAVGRREFDSSGQGDREWFRLSQRAQADHPIGPYSMSDVTKAVLWGGFDFGDMAERRRANYRYLLQRLEPLALWSDLPDDVVPLGFPICL